MASLKATHREDLDALLSDCTNKLQRCEENMSLEKGALEKRVVSLKESVVTLEKERNQLLEEQVKH